MPIYDYHCTACGVDSEVMHKISDPPATECPECGKPALVKQVSAAGFRLSGGGWYETDFKKSGDKQKNLAGESASKAEAASKPEAGGKTDTASKPDTGSKPEAAVKPAASDKPASKPKTDAAA